MKPPGAYKIRARRGGSRELASPGDPLAARSALLGGACRTQRVIESLRREITSGGSGPFLRIRMVFERPREIYRVEISRPEQAYHRTTLLERDALEELLAADEVSAVLESRLARVAER